MDADDGETSCCSECGTELDMQYLDVLGVGLVRYRCPVHGVTATMEFL